MSDKTEITEGDERTIVSHDGDGDVIPSKLFEIAQDPIVGDWCVVGGHDGGVGEFYVETRDGAIQYALQRCGVIEDGDWTRAPERC